MAFSHDKISSIFESTNTARRRLSFGATRGLPLVVKHVKPIKVGGSWLTNEFGFDQLLVAEAESEVRTADAPVLRETDSWVRRELGRFDLTSGSFNQLAKLLPLLFGDRSQEVLNLRDAFPHESHNGDVGDARDPGVADELKVERSQPLGLIWVSSTRGLPFQQTPRAVQVANGIDIGHEFVAARERADDLLLHVAFGLANPDAVISGKLFQETNSLAKQALPVISVGVLERNIAVRAPFFEQHGPSILALEECRDCLLETAAKTQRRPRVLLPPAVQVPKPVAS